MLIFVIAVLGIATTLSIFLKRKRHSIFLLFFIMLCLYFMSNGFLTQHLLSALQPSSKTLNPIWKDRNLIVVLGLGTTQWKDSQQVSSHPLSYSRIFEAARLYFQCKKMGNKLCRILASGGDPFQKGVSEADVLAEELKQLNVLSSDIIVENKSRNTFQNAQYSYKFIQEGEYHKVVLVTSGIHILRSHLYFSHFLQGHEAAPSDYLVAISSWVPMDHNISYIDMAMHEILGIIIYKFYNYMGWNPEVEKIVFQ